MGENPWKEPEELLNEKLGRLTGPSASEAMVRGVELEPQARKFYTAVTGKRVQPACVQSSQYGWLRASLDGLSDRLDTVVEIKCGESCYRRTAESGQVPGYYYGQLQHILAVTGLQVIDFFCYLPNAPELLVPVRRDDRYIERLINVEYQFWTRISGAGYAR